GEAAQAAGDEDRAAVQAPAVGQAEQRLVIHVRERRRLYAQQVLRVVRRRLFDQVVHQVAAADRREAGDVEDLLLRVHRGDLAAGFRQRVDHGYRQPTEAGVVRREQPGRAGSYDGEVDLTGVAHDSDPTVVSPTASS